jgi:hypothetical protein
MQYYENNKDVCSMDDSKFSYSPQDKGREPEAVHNILECCISKRVTELKGSGSHCKLSETFSLGVSKEVANQPRRTLLSQ